MDHDLVEVLLRNSRPEVRADFHDELEEKLFPAPRRLGWMPRLPRPALVAAATTAAMAACVLGLSLAGSGPLSGSDAGVKATSNCKLVEVTRRERVPYLARSADGQPRIAFRIENRQRQVKRCP
ncbi:MAG: hypothetical protein WKF29_02090 [Thermoleophilaceae bacterium]